MLEILIGLFKYCKNKLLSKLIRCIMKGEYEK